MIFIQFTAKHYITLVCYQVIHTGYITLETSIVMSWMSIW